MIRFLGSFRSPTPIPWVGGLSLMFQINHESYNKISESAHQWLDQNDSPMLRRIARLKRTKQHLT